MYNLLDEPWIPVLRCNGQVEHLGIRKALVNAHEIRNIATSNPMDRFAVLRFLLAILYWCKGNPTEADRRVTRFSTEWFDKKLEENRECFSLLGEGKRFYQRPGTLRPRPTTDLIHELPTANNPWHFRHLMDGQDGLCVNCCVLGLLRLPLFTTFGGKGGAVTNYFFPGINGSPPIYTMVQGESLCMTLTANWQSVKLSLGHPNWENIVEHSDAPTLLNGLTHLPRLIWLGNVEEGICVLCGSEKGLIRECNIESPGRNEDEHWIDPHTLFRRDKNEQKPIRSIDPTKSKFVMNSNWTSIHAACYSMKADVPRATQRWLVAFTTDKADKVDVTESYVGGNLNNKELENLTIGLSSWQSSVRLPQRAETKRCTITSAFRPHVEHVISQRASELFSSGEEGWKEAAAEWERPLRAAARSLAPDYTAEELLRRRDIERALPRWSESRPAIDKLRTEKVKRA